jgi:hypothetical protein
VAPRARKAVDASDSDIAKAVGTRLAKDTQLPMLLILAIVLGRL